LSEALTTSLLLPTLARDHADLSSSLKVLSEVIARVIVGDEEKQSDAAQ
jgi:hypothetical protein